MLRAAHPYDVWEDYRAGMFDTGPIDDRAVELARALLASPGELSAAMKAATVGWPRAAEHNLTNLEANRRAWLGAAACHYVCRAPEKATRAAWWSLTPEQQRAANDAADIVINEWEKERTGAQTLPW